MTTNDPVESQIEQRLREAGRAWRAADSSFGTEPAVTS